jgi:hypothetical protein
MLEEFQDSCLSKHPNFMPSMFDIQHVIDFEQPLDLLDSLSSMPNIQHIIDFE